ncbi:VirB2 family type IV secretion system major pilin TrwL, partial [Bartonella sp. MR168JLCBS]|uniref:VirB2 family type IV secretion system major pilin TrwL n=1 Tax=Bartonella sp. MR168JLCBS TaxID=3243556 RepID=UPI0035D0C6D8
MKQLDNLQSKSNDKSIAIAAAITVFFMAYPAYAQAQALNNAKTVLEKLKTELTTKIIPIAAALILLCLAIGYAGRYIEKDTFIRWA